MELDGLEAGRAYRGRLIATDWAGTTYGEEEPFTAGWAEQEVKKPEHYLSEGPGGKGVSCTSTTFCMVIDQYQAESTTYVGGETTMGSEEWDGSGWETHPIPAPPEEAKQFYVEGVSCLSPVDCEAVGSADPSGGAYRNQPIATHWDGGRWSSESLPMPSGLVGTALERISCPSSSFCMAVGGGYNASTPAIVPTAISFGGKGWEPQSPPNPAGLNFTTLSGISCTSAGFCMAVGSGRLEGSTSVPEQPVAERWNGTGWTVERPPIPPGANPTAALADVSCTSTTWCEAVGNYRGPEGVGVGYAEHWNGSNWTTEAVPHTATLNGISCLTQGSCQAVGEAASKARLTAGGWQEEPDVHPSGRFEDVSCSSTTACMAVGSGGRSYYSVLAETLAPTPMATVTEQTVKHVGEVSAELVGKVNPEDSDTKVRFEYGTTTSYGTTTTEIDAGSGVSAVEEDQVIGSLEPGTLYHYRIVATNAGGTTRSKDQTFETTVPPRSAELAAMATTDPLNGTSGPISNFPGKWTALPWDGTSSPKGEDRTTGWGPTAAWPSVAGASYGPTVTDLGTGVAVEATMAAGPALTEGYFSLWLDMPGSPTTKAGYQLRFLDTAPNTYAVSLVRWSAGSPTVLRELTGQIIPAGDTVALVDEGSRVSAWTATGAGAETYTELTGAADSTYSGGTVAVEGSGSSTRLTNLRFGALRPKATGMGAALGELRLDDALATAESPLSEGGIWAALAWDNGTSGHNTGRVAGGWGPYDAFNTLDGAYWTTASFADTGSGDAVGATLAHGPELAEGRHFDLWLDMPAPASARSGYELRFTEKVAGSYEVMLARYQGGTQSVLALKSGVSVPVGSRIALADKGGALTAWTTGTLGFTQLLTATDTTFTSGYAGIAGAGNATRLTEFRAGPLAPF
ncbi:MAG: hypothetical protein JSU06_03470 [Actinobacteria bacterium]|nr:hypothetical protein [Actinomycetota bacterium]